MPAHPAMILQVGHMIQAESDPVKRDEYLKRLMDLPNQVGDSHWTFFFKPLNSYSRFLNDWWCDRLLRQKWAEIIGQASQRVDILKDQDVIRTVLNILQVIHWACSNFLFEFSSRISEIKYPMAQWYCGKTSICVNGFTFIFNASTVVWNCFPVPFDFSFHFFNVYYGLFLLTRKKQCDQHRKIRYKFIAWVTNNIFPVP